MLMPIFTLLPLSIADTYMCMFVLLVYAFAYVASFDSCHRVTFLTCDWSNVLSFGFYLSGGP